uniref:Uncharacterized protein LOC105648802 n=1 Tax=Rhizophora mucronata TaxID=61149 RepID=A0A2P2MD55_RHIMU
MEKFPKSGTDESVHATFRLISNNVSSFRDAIGKSVMLEPFDLPGTVLVQQGKEESLAIASSNSGDDSTFHLVSGLDGQDGTVSLESGSQKGCFVFSGGDDASRVKLSCKSSDTGFSKGASFVMNKGLSEYHPISFVAKGEERNFVLAPLFSLRDESYTVYFNIHA